MEKDSLEYKLNFKLRSGQISQEEYEELLVKFSKLGMLSSKGYQKHKVHLEGSKTIDAIKIEGPVTFSGGVTVDGPVECTSLSTSGSIYIIGHLIVKGKTGVSGELIVDQDVKLIGPSTITGTLRVNDNLIGVDRISITGNLYAEDVTLGERLNVLGKMQVGQLRSASEIRVIGSIKAENIVASQFIFKSQLTKSEKSHIEKDIMAEVIQITSPMKTLKLDLEKLSNLKMNIKIPGVTGLDTLINTTVNQFLPDIVGELNQAAEKITASIASIGNLMTAGFTINGNVKGKQIILSHVTVNGDVEGDIIQLLTNVIVRGKIRYTESFSTQEEGEFDLEKIN